MRFLAHIVMRPNDGKPIFTVENEFEATSWHAAYQHCLGIGEKFDAYVMSHRLRAADSEGEQTVTFPVTPALPAPEPVKEEKADRPPKWLNLVTVAFPEVKPWPIQP